MGGTVSAPVLAGILNGCGTKPAEEVVDLVFLTQEQFKLVEAVAETIMPATDTPGAKDAGVPAFVDYMLADCYPKDVQDRFKKGLDDFDAECKQELGKSYAALSAEEQIGKLKKVEQEVIGNRNNDAYPFYRTLKELTLFGFFTSEAGATQVLDYQHVPGRYEGCYDMPAGQKAWA